MLPINIDQVAKGLERNIQNLDKENFNKLLTIFLLQIQELQEHTIEIADQKNIDIATGVWLDWIGKIIGEKREARNDVDFRQALKLRIGINTSDGTPDNIITLTKQLTSAIDSKLIEYPLASFISVVSSGTLPNSTLWQLVDDIKPAAVSTTVVHNLNGTRFIPAWNRQDILFPVEEPLLLDAGDNLLLDDGLDVEDYLLISYVPPNIYNPDDNYILGWKGEIPVGTDLILDDGGTLLLDEGDDNLLVSVIPQSNITSPYLAQKILSYTTN